MLKYFKCLHFISQLYIFIGKTITYIFHEMLVERNQLSSLPAYVTPLG